MGKGKGKNRGGKSRAKDRQRINSAGAKQNAKQGRKSNRVVDQAARSEAVGALQALIAKAMENRKAERGASGDGRGLHRNSGLNAFMQDSGNEGVVAGQEGTPKSLALREPDEQAIEWRYSDGPGSEQKPVTAIWTWQVTSTVRPGLNGLKGDGPAATIVAEKNFKNGTYSVHIKYPYSDLSVFDVGGHRGTPEFESRQYIVSGSAIMAKRMSEALLSAADWAKSFNTVLGDFSSEKWRNRVVADHKNESDGQNDK